ncbi:MAG: hypothetical protein Q7P63_17275 [Verrucomicrobiota bacterium JB022]|nr:hypothetical protein [Verrucomicrobiota bacterium JB022]
MRLRFLTVDVQMDHFWLVVRSWSAEGQSRLLWCQRALTWEEIEQVQERFEIHPGLVFIDAGYNSYEVYRRCAARGWTALMGDGNHASFWHNDGKRRMQRFYSPARRTDVSGRTCLMHYWSNLSIKDILARLRRESGPDGETHMASLRRRARRLPEAA